MNILFDIGHPAHVHYFKYVIRSLEAEGHTVFISARERYPVFELLEAYGFTYYNRGKGANSKIGKLIHIFSTDVKLLRFARKNSVDIMVGFGSFYLSHVAWIMGKTSIIIDDTDNAILSQKLYRPFATKILSPSSFRKTFGPKHTKFNSFMELAYLHPNYFKPDKSIRKILQVTDNEPYVLVRFVSWNAHHDIGHKGLSTANKIRVATEFSKYVRVFISSESPLPVEIRQYEIKIPPHRMHDAISESTMLFGESATMASEAAMLGIPAIYIDNKGRSYTDELEKKYKMVYNHMESEEEQSKAIDTGCKILSGEITTFSENRALILAENINVTQFLTDEIKNSIEKKRKSMQ